MIHTLPAWLELLSLAFCTGALVCRLWVFPPSVDGGQATCELTRSRLWGLFGIAVSILMFFSVMDLFVRATEMSGAPVLSVAPVLPTVLFRTHYGGVWIARILAEIVLLILWRSLRNCQVSRIYLYFALVLTVIISATESASGHASDKGDLSLPEIADFLHLLASSFWGGGLLVLSLFLLPEILRLEGDHLAVVLAGVARRFSGIAGFAVGIVGITAVYNGFSYVGKMKALWSTDYGLTVIVKIILFVVLVGLGAFNRYVNVPGLQGWAGMSVAEGVINRFVHKFLPGMRRGRDIAERFRRSVRLEALLIIGVLLCAALLRHEVPGVHALHVGQGVGKGLGHEMHERQGTNQERPLGGHEK